MGSMISDDGLRNSKSIYDMIEQEESGSLTVLCICRHGLIPLCKIVNVYDYVTMTPVEVGLQCMKSIPHLEKGPTTTTG